MIIGDWIRKQVMEISIYMGGIDIIYHKPLTHSLTHPVMDR